MSITRPASTSNVVPLVALRAEPAPRPVCRECGERPRRTNSPLCSECLAEDIRQGALARRVADKLATRMALPSPTTKPEAVAPRASTAPTLSAFAKTWTSGDLHRKFPDYVKDIASAKDNKERLAYATGTKLTSGPYSTVGDVPLDRFEEDHGLAVMAALPEHLSKATRRHVARALSRLLNLAVFPARIIKVNPLPRGFVPPPPKKKAGAWWTPEDDAALAACADVPLVFRFFYSFTFREGLREDEAAELTWRDFNFTRGSGRLDLDENKTDEPRAWALWPGTAEALQAWKKILKAAGLPTHDDAPVFVHHAGRFKGTKLYTKRLAEMFRGHIERADLWRPEFEAGANRMRMRFHDLRAGFVSWALATGRNEAWVTDRTGHKSSTMIYGYKRRARTERELDIKEPASLAVVLPELAKIAGAADHPKKAGTLRQQAEVAEWQTQRIQNPSSERA